MPIEEALHAWDEVRAEFAVAAQGASGGVDSGEGAATRAGLVVVVQPPSGDRGDFCSGRAIGWVARVPLQGISEDKCSANGNGSGDQSGDRKSVV